MAEPLLPGDPRQLGAFYLDRRLGSGGQGVVYEGYGPSGDRVAVKVLHGVSDRDRDLFRREAWAWRRVEPFCTAKVLHTDLDGSIPFVVSEYVAGRELWEAVTRDGPYGPQELRRLAIGVATALVAIHRAGVVHRDLKPENILLGPDGPRVIDFGIARIEELSTTTGAVKGTLRYMPPERHHGRRGDAKVDVWGWGAVVLFAATGRPAFDGESLLEIQHQVATHEPDVSAIDEPLRSLVSAALAKDPANRPRSEDLLLRLVGRADLAEVIDDTVPGHPPAPAPPSRAELAEAVFASLGTTAQEAVPQVFLRLVASGERAEDTLRSARRSEFADGRTDEQILEQVLRDFTTAGILVWEDEVVALASAALIRAWPRLRAWAQGERDGLGVHQGICAASRLWDDHGRKNSDLYQGTVLERALSWAATSRRHLSLNLSERAFLDAASALARRRTRQRALLSAVLAVLLFIAVGAVAVVVDQRQTVVGQRDRAASAQIAGLAMSLRSTDPELARRLAVAAARLSGTSESWSALLALRHQQEDDAFKLPGFEATKTEALDRTGRTLVAAADTRVGFWDVETRKEIGSYTAPARVHGVDLSADGRTAAVSTDDGYTRMIAASSTRPRDTHAYPSAKQDTGYWPRTAVSPLGTYLLIEATNSDMKKSTLTVWDTRTARKIITVTRSGLVFFLDQTSFSPDERVISLPGSQGKPFTWFDTRTKKEMKMPLSSFYLKPGDPQGPVVFSADGRSAAVQLKGGTIRVFDLATGTAPITDLTGGEDATDSPIYFSHDGRYVEQDAILWDTNSLGGDPVMRYSTTQSECFPPTAFRFTADDSKLRCVGTDGIVRALDVSPFTKTTTLPEGRRYDAGAVSRDRSTIALAQGNEIDIWSPRTRTKRSAVTVGAGIASPSPDGIELSRDGRLLAALVGLKEIEIWDLAKNSMLGRLPTPLDGDQRSGALQEFAFSPDDKSLAIQVVTKDGNNALAFWDLTTMRRIGEVRANLGYDGDGAAVSFYPDGKSVIAAPNLGRVAFPSGQTITKGAPNLQVDAISDNGATLYTYPRGYQPYIRLWDARTLQPVGGDLRTGPVTYPLLGSPSQTTPASPDGRLVATVHQTAPLYPQIEIWDIRTRTRLGVPLIGPAEEIVAMTFTSDGSALTSVDKHGRYFTYTIAPTRLIRDICAKSGPLTKQEWKTHIPDIPYRRTC